MRVRRIVGILERRLLGAAMGAVLFIVERRLAQAEDRRREEQVSGGRSEERRAT
jgi:hypothetical protein